MYTGRRSQIDFTSEWFNNTNAFLIRAFGEGAKGQSLVFCVPTAAVKIGEGSQHQVQALAQELQDERREREALVQELQAE